MEPIKLQQRLNDLGYGPIPLFNNYGPLTKAAVLKFQKDYNKAHPAAKIQEDGWAGTETLPILFPVEESDCKIAILSQRGINMTIEFEVTSKEWYEAKLQKPEYPGLNSGVTWGIGFDAGYNTRQSIIDTWGDLVSTDTLNAMLLTVGKKGAQAKLILPLVRNRIVIPYAIAYQVFIERTLPRFTKEAVDAYPGLLELGPDAVAAIVSLVYNRGASMEGQRRVEMAMLRTFIRDKNYEAIASTIEDMIRLWDGKTNDGTIEERVEGLIRRRKAEAAMVRLAKNNDPGPVVSIYYE